MSEFDGGAAAPADSAPVSDVVANQATPTPNPITTDPRPTPEKELVEPEKKEPPSTRDALRKAREQVEAREGKDATKPSDKEPGPTDKAKPVASEPANRADDGKFAPKEGAAKVPVDDQQQPATKAQPVASDAPRQPGDAPARFSADAKAEWATAPQSVRAEVARMEREYEAGFTKHRAAAEAFEPVRKFHDMATQSGTTLDAALEKYVGLETLLRRDPVRGLDEVCKNMGLSLRDVAAHIMGQTPDQVSSQQDATVRQLQQQLQDLQQQVAGVPKVIEQGKQRDAGVAEVAQFASENPRFEELWEDIELLIKSGRAKDLAEAYAKAELLNPAAAPVTNNAPATARAGASAAQTPLAGDHTPKGQKSISGAPSSGSDPVSDQRPSSSIKDALRRAKQQAAG